MRSLPVFSAKKMSGLALRTHYGAARPPIGTQFRLRILCPNRCASLHLIRATCVCVAAIGNDRLIAVLKRNAH
jgi:hypothetical protein